MGIKTKIVKILIFTKIELQSHGEYDKWIEFWVRK